MLHPAPQLLLLSVNLVGDSNSSAFTFLFAYLLLVLHDMMLPCAENSWSLLALSPCIDAAASLLDEAAEGILMGAVGMSQDFCMGSLAQISCVQ